MTSAGLLTTLLTTESLLFAVFALTLALPGSAAATVMLGPRARRIALGAAFILTALASGAIVAWVDVFCDPWPDRFARWYPAVTIALGAVAQPIFAWIVVRNLYRKPVRDFTDRG